MGAGEYEIILFGRWTPIERAWQCPRCGTSWYDGELCPRCNISGFPEPLPKGAREIGEDAVLKVELPKRRSKDT